jgi:hypothetical protein
VLRHREQHVHDGEGVQLARVDDDPPAARHGSGGVEQAGIFDGGAQGHVAGSALCALVGQLDDVLYPDATVRLPGSRRKGRISSSHSRSTNLRVTPSISPAWAGVTSSSARSTTTVLPPSSARPASIGQRDRPRSRRPGAPRADPCCCPGHGRWDRIRTGTPGVSDAVRALVLRLTLGLQRRPHRTRPA